MPVALEPLSYWKVWEAHLWVGQNVTNNLPLHAENGKVNLQEFPYSYIYSNGTNTTEKLEAAEGERVATTSFTVPLNARDFCPPMTNTNSTYNFQVAVYALVAEAMGNFPDQ